MFFFEFIMRCTGIEMRTVRFFFFDRDYEVCRLDLIFLFTDTATEFTEQAAAVLLAAVPKIFYNVEFDPGSGWTLATGLTHASRGASGTVLAQYAGDRRTGE